MPTDKSGVSLYNLSTWQSTFYIHGNLWYLTFAKKKVQQILGIKY